MVSSVPEDCPQGAAKAEGVLFSSSQSGTCPLRRALRRTACGSGNPVAPSRLRDGRSLARWAGRGCRATPREILTAPAGSVSEKNKKIFHLPIDMVGKVCYTVTNLQGR